MRTLTFKKGVHPKDMKHFSKDKPITPFETPKIIYIPVSQHIGAPAKVIVAKGDKVIMGQKIAESGGFVSANIHSSVSGTVKDILFHPCFLGMKVETIVIENDGNYEKQYMNKLQDPTGEEIIKRISDAGIVGLGGATFPTHVKLSPPKEKVIDAVLLNAAECEPYLTSDYRLMMERTEEVIAGFKMIMKALNVKKGYIGIEENKPDAYSKLKNMTGGNTGIDTVLLKAKYPQGGEKQLIYAVLKRKVPAGGLPMDVGCVVQNVGTAYACYEAVNEGKPLFEKIVTVTGAGIEEPANFLVKIGTPLSSILEKVKMKENAGKIIFGGPMMGFAVDNMSISITKGTGGILVLDTDRIFKDEYDVCIRCGKCVDVCPMNLSPYQYIALGEKKMYLDAEQWNAMDCIECGSCVFACPSKRPIVQYVKIEKAKILEKRRESKK